MRKVRDERSQDIPRFLATTKWTLCHLIQGEKKTSGKIQRIIKSETTHLRNLSCTGLSPRGQQDFFFSDLKLIIKLSSEQLLLECARYYVNILQHYLLHEWFLCNPVPKLMRYFGSTGWKIN